ncbi:MAG TPA: FAD/NAD(P)-binding oxidoreductase [Roseiflexaceae bacterium]|nr:FAD/NAD(P)-binding oxidoreductase [Roseiflexaceae bacterium]
MATTTLVLGGGFGGIAAANTLRRLVPEEHAITVIDRSSHFHVGAGKTWVMLGERSYEQIAQARAALLAPGVRFLQARVLGLDLASRTVVTEGERLRWDHLVLAVGAELNPAAVPGLAEAAHTFYTIEGAQRLRGELERFDGGEIAFLMPRVPFACPPAPYEAALLLHHALQRRGLADRARIAIYTAEGAPMATAGPEMGQFVREELARRAIAYHPQRQTARVEGAARRIVFADGAEAPYDLLIAVPPHEAPSLVRDAGLTNQTGWVPVDPQTLRVQSGPGQVYAVGDITVMPLPGRFKPEVALSLPKAGVFAAAHGRAAAHQIAAAILGRAPEEVFDGRGFCYLELGGGRAVRGDGEFFALPHPVMRRQTPDEAQLQDKLAWVARQLAPLRMP